MSLQAFREFCCEQMRLSVAAYHEEGIDEYRKQAARDAVADLDSTLYLLDVYEGTQHILERGKKPSGAAI